MKYFACLALFIGIVISPVTSAQEPLTIEGLLSAGWDIAGYAGTADNRSTMILFRHRDKKYLVQCMAFFDVMRKPRTTVNCYELR